MKTERMEARSGGLRKMLIFFKRNNFSGLNFYCFCRIFSGMLAGIFFILAATCLTSPVKALEITPEFQIVKGNLKGIPEESAITVLSEHLEKIFDKKLAVADAGSADVGRPAIILTEDPKLDTEEWSIRSDGKNLLISGGFPRGVYYGVCEFLEKFAGVRWFTAWETKIPTATKITIQDGKEFRRRPEFPMLRYIVDSNQSRNNNRFMSYHKSNSATPFGRWPTLFSARGIGNGHTFWKLTKAVPKDREDLLPLLDKKYRVRAINGEGPGQICFSNPEFRKFAKEEIAKWIADEEKYIKDHGLTGGTWLRWIDLSQNDNASFCECPGCKALEKKYGALSGAQLEFVNDIAAAFPDRLFQTFAYHGTSAPPKNIKARDNVMIQFAFLSDKSGAIDTIRPLSHPVNACLLEMYNSWEPLAKHKAVWAYHRLYSMTESFIWPQCGFWYIAEDMRYYQKSGMKKMFLETEYVGNDISPRAFHDLHVYLAACLMDDPQRDEKKLIDDFFEFQYGPAEPEMREYADYLKKRLDAVPGRICFFPLPSRSCFNIEFFTKINGLLDHAEAKAKNDPALRKRIAIERLPVDFAAAYMWDKYGSKVFPSRNVLCDRLEENVKIAYDRYFPDKTRKVGQRNFAESFAAMMQKIKMLRNPIPIPKGFENLDIIQISSEQNNYRVNVDDPDATYGNATKLGKVSHVDWDHEKCPMMFGLYDHTLQRSVIGKVFKPEEVPQDEKYHLHFIGRCVPNGLHKQTLWGHRSWELNIAYMFKQVWSPADPDREFDIYISCKMTGPAYVKGSKSENAVYVDKIVAVKRGIHKQEVEEDAK